jgi:Stigma-specific protein, Stig1
VCPPPNKVCNGECVNLQTDSQNCGACNQQAPYMGSCQGGVPECPAGKTLCSEWAGNTYPNGVCVDTTSDYENCGFCGNKCRAPGQECCGGHCKDIYSDVNNCGQCGNACANGLDCQNGFCRCPSPAFLAGDLNYAFSNSCQPILGLNVSLQVTQDITALSNAGFSMQLNAYSPKFNQNTDINNTPDWQQFWIQIENNQIFGKVQTWDFNAQPACLGPFFLSFATPAIATLPSKSNTVPAGYNLGMTLINDQNGNVTGVTFQVIDNSNPKNTSSQTLMLNNIPGNSANPFPINAFQLNVVAPAGGSYSTFSSGAGIITYEVPHGQLIDQGDVPSTCTETQVSTGENSNASYGSIFPCSGSSITQSLCTQGICP